MGKRVTRSQQRRQEEEETERESRASSHSASASANGSVDAAEETPRKGRSPMKKHRLTAVAVVVEQPGQKDVDDVDGGVSLVEQEGKKGDETKSEGKETNGVKLNGAEKKATHKRFNDDAGEHETAPSTKIIIEAVLVEKKPETRDEAAKTSKKDDSEQGSDHESDEDDDDDDDDDAPEAVSLSTGRQAILAREEEIKKAREQQDLSARLKRKTHDARLKEQKAASQPQPPPAKRQKFQSSTSEPNPAASASTSTFTSIPTSSKPIQNSTVITTTTTITSAEPPSPTGLLSPTSSTTLSLQHPPTDPNHPLNLSRLRNNKVPLLLPESLLDEVARTPSIRAVLQTNDTKIPFNSRKTLVDFEAEEKAALEAFERKKVKSAHNLPTFKKGPVHVAVLGKEEQREKDRRLMAPPGSKKVSNVKEFWMAGRKLQGGERRAILPIGGKSFVRRN